MEEAKNSDGILRKDKQDLLIAVCNNAPIDVVTSLISPSSINMQDTSGNTALHVAVRENRWELVPVLVQHGADVNTGNDRQATPLHWAACCGAPVDIFTTLISPHNINMQEEDCETALHVAVRENRWELVPVLLQHGADVNLHGMWNKRTPLHLAACYGAPADIITKLISPHNFNMQNEGGNTVLHLAVNKKRWELVPVLLQHGVDINVGNDCQETPLYLAACRGAPVNIFTTLISPHNINMRDEDGNTALHLAVYETKWEQVQVLLQHRADINIRGYDYYTPLHCAACLGAPADITTQLISSQNINIEDKDGNTALHKAVRENRWELVPVLLQHGADPYVHDILPEPPWPLSLQSLTVATIRSHMLIKSDEMFEGLGLPKRLLPELKLKLLADEIVAIKQNEDVK